MPTVPRYDQARVGQAGINVGGQNPNAPIEAFGGGAAQDRLNNAIQGVANVALEIGKDAKQQADQLAILDADRQLSEMETRIQYDPEKGVMNKKGKDAFSLPESVKSEWDKGFAEISKGLHNDTQRLAIQRMANSRYASLNNNVQRYVSSEIAKYDDEVTENYITNERDAAAVNYLDPERITLSLQRQQMSLALHAKRKGLPEEWLKAKILDANSKTHMSVANRMLANGEDLTASEYFKANREMFTGADATTMEKALEEGSLRGNSQRESDAIVRKAVDRGAALEQVRKIQDPKLRDETERRVNQFYSNQKAAESETREKIYLDATNIIDNAAPGQLPKDVIPPNLWSELSLEQRNALENRIGDRGNDDQVWLDFLALNPNETASLSRGDFESKYWAYFDKEHRTRAENMWNTSRDAVGKKEAGYDSIFTDRDMILNAAHTSGIGGIKPSDSLSDIGKSNSKSKIFSDLESQVDRAFQRHFKETGKNPNDEQKQKIIDDLIVKKVFVDKSWRLDPQKPAALVTDEERGDTYVPFNQIPVEDRNAIAQSFLRNKKKATPDKIQRAYAAYILDDRRLFQAILDEK